MKKYQLGLVKKQGTKKAMVIDYNDTIYDFDLLLAQPVISNKVKAENLNVPTSLMDIMEEWQKWEMFIPKIIEDIAKYDNLALLETDIEWLPPLEKPGKILCVGINYRDHIKEMGLDSLPEWPYTFFKPTSSLSGHNFTVPIPDNVKKADWEAELGVIIGKKAYNVKKEDALNYVAGYTIINDLSSRDWVDKPSIVGFDWVLAKAYDYFLPIGPFITPSTFINDPQDLNISLTLNGVEKQAGNTSNMVFSVAEIIEHLSSIGTLEPGDIIATGTPAGVSQGEEVKQFLKSGDVLEITIDEIGKLTTKMD